MAIIGAGWSGLAIAAKMKEYGVAFKGFDTADDVGGTWHPSRRYANLSLHTPGYAAAFEDHAFPNSSRAPSGESVQQYMRSFAEQRGLMGSYSFSTRVDRVDYDPRSRTCTLVASAMNSSSSRARPQLQSGRHSNETQGSGSVSDPPAVATVAAEGAEEQQWGPFEMVIYASLASTPWTPKLEGKFDGISCHACEVTQTLLETIAARQQRVVVVGGGKSSCEVAIGLIKAGVPRESLHWLIRRPYTFLKYERFFHRRCFHEPHPMSEAGSGDGGGGGSGGGEGGGGGDTVPTVAAMASCTLADLLSFVRALLGALAFGLATALPRVGWRLLWALDYLHAPHERSTHSQIAVHGGSTSKSNHGEGVSRSDELFEPSSRWSLEPAYHMGILTAEQRRLLGGTGVVPYLLVKDEPERFEGGHRLVLRSSRQIEGVDAVIWATGYRTGAMDLRLGRGGGLSADENGRARARDDEPPRRGALVSPTPGVAPLFEHIIPPAGRASHCPRTFSWRRPRARGRRRVPHLPSLRSGAAERG